MFNVLNIFCFELNPFLNSILINFVKTTRRFIKFLKDKNIQRTNTQSIISICKEKFLFSRSIVLSKIATLFRRKIDTDRIYIDR